MIALFASLWCALGAACAAPEPPVLGPEVTASVNPDGGDLQCEPAVAIHGDKVLVAWNDSWGGRQGAPIGVAVAWSYSNDGGATFRPGGYLPEAEGDFLPSSADARIAVDSHGNAYLLILSWQRDTKGLHLYRFGGDWSKSEPMPNPVRHQEGLLDKPALCIAPDDSMTIAYTGPTGILATTSRDRGRSWSQPALVSENSKRTRTGCSVVATGEHIVVGWLEGSGMKADKVWTARSANRGRTFDPPKLTHKLSRTLTVPDGYTLAGGKAGFISNDTGLALLDGVIAFSIIESGQDGAYPILLTSTDHGLNWSDPVRATESEDDNERSMCSVAASRDRFVLIYYDRRIKTDDPTDTHVWLTTGSSASGWSDTTLTRDPTLWSDTPGDLEFAPVQRNFGDYITVASHHNRFIAAWTDGRTGKPRIMTRAGWFD